MTSKLSYLQKYVKSGEPKKDRKKVKRDENDTLRQPFDKSVKIIDEDLDIIKENSSADDENPLLLDNAEFNKLPKEMQHKLLRKGYLDNSEEVSSTFNGMDIPSEVPKEKTGTWVVIDEKQSKEKGKKQRARTSSSDSSSSDSSSSDSDISRTNLEKRKRVDTDSDDNEMKDIKKKEKKDMKKVFQNALGIEESKEEASDKSDSDIDIDRNNPPETESMASGTRTATEFKMDLMLQKKKDSKLKKMAEKFKRTETVYRDASGRRIDIKEKLKEALVDKKKELEKINQERINEWGAGAIQKQEKEQKKDDLKKLQKETFIQHSISKELDITLMKNDREGDPLLRMLKKDEKNDSEVFTNKLKRKCKFPGIPNRFGIEPGYRWDGVDRSNGYEKRYIESNNTRELRKKLAYLENVREL